jgi:hypothetical protein
MDLEEIWYWLSSTKLYLDRVNAEMERAQKK